jgi:hypothetical protein
MNHIPTPEVIMCELGVIDCCIIHSDTWPNDTCWTYQHPEKVQS